MNNRAAGVAAQCLLKPQRVSDKALRTMTAAEIRFQCRSSVTCTRMEGFKTKTE